MNTAEVLEQVRDFLHEELGVPREEIEPAADLRKDLGLDSLDLVELVTAMEDRIGARVDKDVLAEVATVGDVIELGVALSREPRASV